MTDILNVLDLSHVELIIVEISGPVHILDQTVVNDLMNRYTDECKVYFGGALSFI